MSRHTLLIAAAAALVTTGVARAEILELQLSTHSSDETPFELFSATFVFSLVGSTLTLSVTNDTLAPNEYNINELYFNLGGGWTGIAEDTMPTGWSLSTDDMVNGFGIFDVGLTDGVGGGNEDTIMPGEKEIFILTLAGSGTVKDLTAGTSTNGYLIAGKFISGPGDDSGFGATIPAPGVLALLGVAGLVSGRRRRRD